MDRKIVMLLIGIVAIGMFALPSTLAMYSGQHDFIAGTDVNCSKCHSQGGDQIYTELAGGPHSSFSCKQCHGFDGGVSNPNDNSTGMGHAATVDVTCVGCHSDTSYAGGVNGLDGNNVTVATELANGAHDAYYNDTADQDDACLGCHTTIAVTGAIGAGGTEGPLNLTAYNY